MGCVHRFAWVVASLALFASGLAGAVPGALDTGFGTAGIVRTSFGTNLSSGTGVAVQPDGRIVTVGDGNQGIGYSFAVARFNADGSSDTTFNGTGRVASPFLNIEAHANAVALQADGKIVVAGRMRVNDTVWRMAIARYNANGSLDAAFGNAGLALSSIGGSNDSAAYAVAIQPDGRIVTAGSVLVSGNDDLVVARFTTDGLLDTTFNATGYRIQACTANPDRAQAILLRPDGRILAAGYCSDDPNAYFRRSAILALTANGSYDTTMFGGAGFTVLDLDTSSDYLTGVAMQPDGRLVFSGSYDAGVVYGMVLRLLSDGTGDPSFNGTGRALVTCGTSGAEASAVVVQPDGRIAVGGGTSPFRFAVSRLNPDGTRDTTFSATGCTTIPVGPYDDAVHAMALQGDGRILAVGTSNGNGFGRLALARLNWDGSRDVSFGDHGLVVIEAETNYGRFRATAVQPDGKIVAVGSVQQTSATQLAVARFHANGAPDLSFNGTGRAVIPVGTYSGGYGVGVQGDGRIVVATQANGLGLAVARFDVDGTLDTTFNGTGVATATIGSSPVARAVAIAPDGRIVVAGSTDNDFALARFYSNGSLDSSFNGNGTVSAAIGPGLDQLTSVAVQADGKVVVAGTGYNGSSDVFALARLNQNGSLDSGFNGTGKILLPVGSPADDSITALAVQPDGRIVAGGYAKVGANWRFALARLNANGALDTSFNATGKVITSISANNDFATSVLLQPDGKIIAVGYTNDTLPSTTTTSVAVVRYTATGALDASFGAGGKSIVSLPQGAGAIVLGAAFADSGRLVVAGGADSDPPFMLMGFLLDETPGAFTFAPQAGVAPQAQVTSNAVTINGITTPATVTVENGTYSIGCNATFTSAQGSIAAGQTVCVRHSASALPGGTMATTLTVGTASATFASTVAKAAPTVIVSLVGGPYFVGNVVPFTATVSGSYGTPTGTVTFFDGATMLATVPVNASGIAINTSVMALAGPRSITATFNGNANYSSLTSSALPATIGRASSTVAIASNGNPVAVGTAVVFTATITVAATPPAGTVRFYSDGDQIAGCSAVAVIASSAFCTTATLAGGVRAVSAVYSGDANYNASASSALLQDITRSILSVAVASSSPSSTYGANVTFTATISAYSPLSPVYFYDGANFIGAGVTTSTTATFTTNRLAAGTHLITAKYLTSDSYFYSSSPQILQTVMPAGSSTALASSAGTGMLGVPLTFTAAIGGAGAEFAGTVAFRDGGKTIAGCAAVVVVNQGAACTTASLANGTHAITATYSGDGNNLASVSGALMQDIAFDPAADADNDGVPNGVELLEGIDPLVKDNAIFTNARWFAMQQYRDFLGREGDAGGIAFYADLLNAGTAIRANVVENFFNSPEFQGVGSPIARLYFATFLRAPDYAGLTFQIEAFRAGTPLTVIANNFTASPEFQSTYGALGNAQFVALLYTNILGRTASQAEIDYHVARLVSGLTRGEVLVGFSESPEYQAAIGNEVYVTMMYVGMLRRAPEPAGLSYWVNYMDAGNPGIALILGFLNAPEYHNRFLP